ncbi:hypothetical protein EMIHUDRAFT_459228 [Emiliania huxleyi CCMP1516]|uniref:Uncharacterized protein n=2 Tax=Emiliania huxleyi TaxID=2903 RepID=A0A0D3IXU0_EMIH1|nr:hypothetical protein EMIHUDRAFT_459228 [Emiliania huxleyi CCMP1516]EOD16075.1 hypothetical protein EMIHUDRAFT_459228 [Emiliania huxleyi CCMP1516]|eukprot:XP_005768504.1 hypothetical protein EMIHUDRAFT_459228 [Emiliania huxleyi CCMP1516]
MAPGLDWSMNACCAGEGAGAAAMCDPAICARRVSAAAALESAAVEPAAAFHMRTLRTSFLMRARLARCDRVAVARLEAMSVVRHGGMYYDFGDDRFGERLETVSVEGDAASGIAFVQRYAGGDCREVSFAASLLRRAVSRSPAASTLGRAILRGLASYTAGARRRCSIQAFVPEEHKSGLDVGTGAGKADVVVDGVATRRALSLPAIEPRPLAIVLEHDCGGGGGKSSPQAKERSGAALATLRAHGHPPIRLKWQVEC